MASKEHLGGETIVYGCSDDLIEIEGAIRVEFNVYGPTVLDFSDDTVLEIHYSPQDYPGVWKIKPLCVGPLLKEIRAESDPDAETYSDVAIFRKGIEWVEAPDGDE